MREIKFRAWDKGLDDGVTPMKLQYFDLASVPIMSIDAKIMQFTGLKDKNGVEIYEGDIVAYKEEIGSAEEEIYTEKAEVKWFKTGEWWPRPIVEDCGDSWYDTKRYDFEVIGNIHENPEPRPRENPGGKGEVAKMPGTC